jgi:glycosyltransferase involved in cell wall biosynthesis
MKKADNSSAKHSPKIAIVHDWMVGGGAEKVVEQLHKLYPNAPIYTSYCSDEWRSRLNGKIVTGCLQNWPFSKLRKFLPLLRMAWFSRLDLSEYDLVISSSGNGEAKFANATKKNAKHICYCHTPPHFLWAKYDEYYKSPSFRPVWLTRLGLKLLAGPLRRQDYGAAQKIDLFIANSNHIKKSIKDYYGRDSIVIHPPVDTKRFNPKLDLHKITKQPDTFITWGRHVPYKRIDLIIEACNNLKLPLLVVGSGPDTAKLKKLAGPTVKFTGIVSDSELENLTTNACAFLFASEEDFGIAPVEAIAAGLPIIAYGSGGALDYVIPGKTGLFFGEQTTESLVTELRKFSPSDFNTESIVDLSNDFSSKSFRTKIRKLINSNL